MARVEGEGALTIRLRDGRVDDVQLRIFEAPRFFEALFAGPVDRRGARHHGPDLRHLPRGVPDELLPRARGACWASACRNRSGQLRRLLYCGEWIESHVLHVAFLHAPDFLGYESAFAMAQAVPNSPSGLRDALQLKKAGNAIVDLVGGREIHPINVRLGGFYRAPARPSCGLAEH